MKRLVIFHPAGLGDFLLDLHNLRQLIRSDLSPRSFTYVCNEVAKPLIQFLGLDRVLDIYYLSYPSIKLIDFYNLISTSRKVENIFVLGGMNLRKIGNLKLFTSNKVNFFGTLQDYPYECIEKIRPNRGLYKYIEGPKENSHRIVENFNLFKSQRLVNNADFYIDSIFLNSSLERLTALFSNSFNEPFIVVHTGLVERKTYKTMSLDYWKNLLLELLNNFGQKIVIIGSKFEKKNIDSILTHVNAGRILNYCGKTDLLETMCLISQSEMVLGVDGGMAHLAAFLKKKLVVIFGPTNPHNVSPVGTDGFIISYPVECSPCYFSKNYYRCPYGRKCLNDLDTNLIIDVINSVIMQQDFIYNKIENYVVQKIPTYKSLGKLLQ